MIQPTYLNLEYVYNKIGNIVSFFLQLDSSDSPQISTLKMFFFIIGIAALLLIFYVSIKMHDMRQHEEEHMEHSFQHVTEHDIHDNQIAENGVIDVDFENIKDENIVSQIINSNTAGLPPGIATTDINNLSFMAQVQNSALHNSSPDFDLKSDLVSKPRSQTPQRMRWNRIEGYLKSDNVSDWKIAIIDADNMLDEVMMHFHFPGDNVGDRLRNAARSFGTSADAGYAHGVRNKIAHDPLFELSHTEANRVISMYKRTFEEFNYLG